MAKMFTTNVTACDNNFVIFHSEKNKTPQKSLNPAKIIVFFLHFFKSLVIENREMFAIVDE